MLNTQKKEQNAETAIDISVQAAKEAVIVRGYKGTQNATVIDSHAVAEALAEDALGGGPTMMKTLVVDWNGLYRVESQAPRLIKGTVKEEHSVATVAAAAGVRATSIAANNGKGTKF